MMALCLALAACGGGETGPTGDALLEPYRNMEGCLMEADVTWTWEETVWEASLRCDCDPDGETTVEVTAPETIAGVTARLSGEDLYLEYDELCLWAGTFSGEDVSPMACLPRLVSAMGEGWLLEENRETWNEEDCYRLVLDQTGPAGGKIVSTVWLRLADGVPLRGEIAVDGENILTAEFTGFSFYDMMDETA